MTETDADILKVCGLSHEEVKAILNLCHLRGIRASKYIQESLLYYADYLYHNPQDIAEPFTVDLRAYNVQGGPLCKLQR